MIVRHAVGFCLLFVMSASLFGWIQILLSIKQRDQEFPAGWIAVASLIAYSYFLLANTHRWLW